MFSQAEVDKFNDLAHEWWNLDGQFKTLHQINPARVEFIQRHVELTGKRLIDVGCGGGAGIKAVVSRIHPGQVDAKHTHGLAQLVQGDVFIGKRSTGVAGLNEVTSQAVVT